jgi:hypothetical protein
MQDEHPGRTCGKRLNDGVASVQMHAFLLPATTNQ